MQGKVTNMWQIREIYLFIYESVVTNTFSSAEGLMSFWSADEEIQP